MAWKCETDEVKCSLVEKTTIVLSLRVQDKVRLLMQEYPSQEWLGYLTGKVTDKITCTDLVIPPHEEANSGTAAAEPFTQPEHCVGVIHSHHTMGAFHSGVDQAHVDKNFGCSITVAKRGSELEFSSVAIGQTPCGKATVVDCQLKLQIMRPTFDVRAFLKEAKANIDRGKKEFQQDLHTAEVIKALKEYRGDGKQAKQVPHMQGDWKRYCEGSRTLP